MGSYLYDHGDAKSPLSEIIKTPDFFKPVTDALYSPMRQIGELLDRPEDQVVYMVASTVVLFANLYLYRFNGTPFQRQLYSTAMGLLIHYYVFGLSGLASLANNLISYITIVMLPRSQSHIAVFAVSGLGLALAQAHRQIYFYGFNGLDVPMNLMFNFSRVTSLACCIRDGDLIKRAKASGKEANLRPREKAYAVEEVPSLFDFLSYLYFCGAAISGPWYEYKDWRQMIDQTGDFKHVPSTAKAAVLRYFVAWIRVATGAILCIYFDDMFPLTEEFANDLNML